ncbi:YobA family protein [Planomicrobium okeanokoites]|uniref:YobA family protein n=1 Tax=Planomicrobium okeanokoites TaxID=244 RepID=UPI0009FC6B0C|nr:YobA family protein [Planomicrobium okeanokoites]
MKKVLILIGVVLIFFIFFYFDNPPEFEPYIEGYVVEADINRLLVVSGISEEQAESLTQKEVVNLANVEAIWVSKFNFFRFREGQKVRVWISGSVAESFPAQAKADYVEVIRD